MKRRRWWAAQRLEIRDVAPRRKPRRRHEPMMSRARGASLDPGPHNRALHPVGRAPRYPRVHEGGGGTTASGARAMRAQIPRGAAAASIAEALVLKPPHG